MRVLFLTHSFPRYAGDAAGSFILRLATALAGVGVAVQVVAPAAENAPMHDQLEGIPIVRFHYAPRRLETIAYAGNMATQVRHSWAARLALAGMLGAELRAALRLSRTVAPDLLHAHWWFPNGVVAIAAGRITGKPVVTTLHGSDVRLARTIAAARPVLRGVMRRSARVTAVSRWLADEARLNGSGAAPIVAPMPAETALFSPGEAPRSDRLLFVGRLTRQKGLDLLLHALTRLPPHIGLDIVGDGEEQGTLEALSARLGLASRLRWHGTLPATALPPLYRAAAAVVVPSSEEGLGLVAVEAQLCETPVVAFASGGLTDVVEDQVTGILVHERSPAPLARALTDFFARPDRGASLGRAGRARALAAFEPAVAARRYADIYADALGRTPR